MRRLLLILAAVAASAASGSGRDVVADCTETPAAAWVAHISQFDEPTALRLAYAEGKLPTTDCDVDVLLNALRDRNPVVRAQSARLLGDTQVGSARAVDGLVLLLSDKHSMVRNHAMLALQKHETVAVPTLLKAAHSTDMHRLHAAAILQRIGAPAVKPITDALLEHRFDLPNATRILTSMSGDITSEVLAAAAQTDNRFLRRWLLIDILLEKYNTTPQKLEYNETLKDQIRLDSSTCVSLRVLIDDPTIEIRETAVRLGAVCHGVAAKLLDDQKDINATIASIIQDAPEAIALRAAQQTITAVHENRLAFGKAVAYLNKLAWRQQTENVRVFLNSEVVPLAVRYVCSHDAHEAALATYFLAAVGSSQETVLTDLISQLDSRHGSVRVAALRALSTIGPPARAAIPKLLSMLNDESNLAGAFALSALFAIAEPPSAIAAALPLVYRPLLREPVVQQLRLHVSHLSQDAVPFLMGAIPGAPVGDIVAIIDLVQAIGGPEAVDEVFPLVYWSNARVRAAAAAAVLATSTRSAQRQAAWQALRNSIDDYLVTSVLNRMPSQLTPDDAHGIGMLLSQKDVPPSVFTSLRRSGKSGLPAESAIREYIRRSRHDSLQALTALFAVAPTRETAEEIAKIVSRRLAWRRYSEYHPLVVVPAVGEIADFEWKAFLPLLQEDDPQSVLGALAILYSTDHIDVGLAVTSVLPMLESSDAASREYAIGVLARFPNEGQVQMALPRMLCDVDERVRVAAVDALAFVPAGDSAPDYEWLATERLAREAEDDRPYTAKAFDDFEEFRYSWSSVERHLEYAMPRLSDRRWTTLASHYPVWPIPSPTWSAYDVIPSPILGSGSDTLETISGRLGEVLRSRGYQSVGVFVTPGGFALMTMAERIHDNGEPYPSPDRWTKARLQPRSFREYIDMLFVEKPGRFRVFVFVISSVTNIGAPTGEMSEERLENLFLESARELPPALVDVQYGERLCHVLVYSLQKEAGRRARVVKQDPLQLVGHLAASGLATALGIRP